MASGNPGPVQTVEDAIWQYRNDRDPKEPLFAQGHCLARFAVDNELAYMATKLAGKKTLFLPFNQSNAGAAGNPPSVIKHPTAYLWEEVWQPYSILELVEKFCADFTETKEDGRKRRVTLFPRYHQLWGSVTSFHFSDFDRMLLSGCPSPFG